MDSHNFVFVTGLHRSGTSPLHCCLRKHPQISGFHNTGVPEDEGQHLQTVLPRGGAYGGPGRFGRHPEVHMTEAHPLATPETARALFTQWTPYWDLSKPTLVEKTPLTLVRTRLFQALFPGAHFVVIMRHPAAVALATYNALASGGSTPEMTLAELIEHWLISHETFYGDAPHLQHLTVVRYEEFTRHPQQALDALYASLGLPASPCSLQVEPNVDGCYLAQWQAMRADPQYRDDIENAMALEERVRAFGYSLEDWHISSPSVAPQEVLETDRLLLRRFTFEDVDDLTVLCADPETMRFLDGPRTRMQIWGDILDFVRAYEQTGLHFWAAVLKDENRLIGRCGLLLQTIDGQNEAEVAYMIARPYWNQGLGTEAAQGIKSHVFRNYPFERLISLVEAGNSASQHVAEKNGMHHEKDTAYDGLLFRIYAVDRPEGTPSPD